MRAKTILALLFLASLGVAATVLLRALPQLVAAAPGPIAPDEILVATMPLAAGTLLRARDVTWQTIAGPPERGEIVRPSAAVRAAKPEADEAARAGVYGAAVRSAVSPGEPILEAPSRPANRCGAAASSSPAIATFCRSCCRPARGQSQSPLPPAGLAPAC